MNYITDNLDLSKINNKSFNLQINKLSLLDIQKIIKSIPFEHWNFKITNNYLIEDIKKILNIYSIKIDSEIQELNIGDFILYLKPNNNYNPNKILQMFSIKIKKE